MVCDGVKIGVKEVEILKQYFQELVLIFRIDSSKGYGFRDWLFFDVVRIFI